MCDDAPVRVRMYLRVPNHTGIGGMAGELQSRRSSLTSGCDDILEAVVHVEDHPTEDDFSLVVVSVTVDTTDDGAARKDARALLVKFMGSFGIEFRQSLDEERQAGESKLERLLASPTM